MATRAVRLPILLLIVPWAVLLASAYLVAPRLLPSDDPADVVTRQSARVAVLFWGLAAAALLLDKRTFGRQAWTLACLAYLVHVATAFDQVHAWSHVAAWTHVEEVSGFGPGIFVSYAFSLMWLADVLWWWLGTASYEARPAWLDRGIHGFMAFVVFNGTVVYETGFIRWSGLALFFLLAALLLLWLTRPPYPVRHRR
jgi:hypothetical protein